MGQQDLSEKILEDYNDVFADIINVLLFQGRQIVKPEELEETKIRSQYKADDKKLHEQERDVAKLWTKTGVIFTLCGLENQTDVDYDMPLRIIGYDGASYRSQLFDKKSKQRYPVMSLILYYGKEPWKAPKTLKERIKVPKVLDDYVSDYRINIFEISHLSKRQISMFRSDFQIVADYFAQLCEGNTYQQNTKKMEHVDAILKFLSVFANDQDYLNIDLSKCKGEITMCVVLQEAKQSGIQEGLQKGSQKTAVKIAENMIHRGLSVELICEMTELPQESVCELKKNIENY